jgi:uroporphyrinogen III methyltransferase/synthase
VDEVTVYRTVPARGAGVRRLRKALIRGGVDAVTFASAQTVKHFASAVGRGVLRRMPRTIRIVSIGPVTSRACRRAGLRVHAEARTPSFDCLVRAAAGLFVRS